MANVVIDDSDLLDMLMERVDFWTDDPTTHALFYDMYENAIESGIFEGCELNVMSIVDNDYVNWCDVIDDGDEENFEPLLQLYNEKGLGCDGDLPGYRFSVLEAVEKDQEGNPVAFLIRC